MTTVQLPAHTRTPAWADTTTNDEGFLIHRSTPVKIGDVVAQLERFDFEDDDSHVGRVDVAVWIRQDGDVTILDLPIKQAKALRNALDSILAEA